MNKPEIQLTPLRSAVCSDRPTYIDILVAIVTPSPEVSLERPKLNIGLVIDRSGSMQGKKIEYARQAACYAVEQLQNFDMVSVTIYDDQVEVLVPATPVRIVDQINKRIKQITPGGSTNLHGGWLEGSMQVSRNLQPGQINRVILLSDGLANVGETNPDTIATHVHGLAQRGVSTSTLGIGQDYNEDLMTIMAESGDGNYYFIESPEQLPSIFQAELQGIKTTFGQRVSLGIKTLAKVELIDVFNDLEQTDTGKYKLPNLVGGHPLEVVLRLKVPALKEQENLVEFTLAWENIENSKREALTEVLSLPVVPSTLFEQLPVREEVSQRLTQLLAARAKVEVIAKLDEGDYGAVPRLFAAVRDQIQQAAPSPVMFEELQNLAELEEDLNSASYKALRKRASYQSYQRRTSRPKD
jgi:Ca-activated chloride channel family protein